MYTAVSDAYKTVINSDIRPTSQFQAEIDAFDTDAEIGISYSYTGMTSGSSSAGWPNFESYESIATFEPGRMTVGTAQHPGTASTAIDYLTSSSLSGEDGVFTTPPTFTLTMTEEHDIAGLTFRFREAYASEIRVTLYNNNTQVSQFTVSPTELVYASYGENYVSCDKAVIEFLALSVPYRRLRLSMLRVGLIIYLSNDNVSSATYSVEVDPISSTMSRYSLSISVIDEDGRYNPDNPNGLWKAFKEKQKVIASMGTTVGDELETVPIIPMYLVGSPAVSRMSATFEAVDAIQTFLNVPFDPQSTSYSTTIHSTILKALSFNSSLMISVNVDPAFNNDAINLPIAYSTTCRDALQQAANAGRGVVYIDSSGTICVKKQDSSTTMNDYSLDYDRLFNKPELNLKPRIKELIVSWYKVNPVEDASVLFEGDVEFTEGSLSVVEIPSSTNISVSVTSGEAITYIRYNHVIFNPTASGTAHIVISGKKLTQDVFSITVPVSPDGETVSLDNHLVSSPDMAIALGKWIADHYSYRQAYSGNMRQDYMLEGNDAVYLETDYGTVPIRLYRLEYTIPGQMGAYEGRRVNALDQS